MRDRQVADRPSNRIANRALLISIELIPFITKFGKTIAHIVNWGRWASLNSPR
jgi:hypothetical protein